MRIAFDSQAFSLQRTGGISRYFCKLAEGLSRVGNEVGVFAPVYRNQYLSVLPKELTHGFRVSDYWPKTAGLMVRANAWMAERSMGRWTPDVVHETYFSGRAALAGHRPVVLTVFDMISEHPEFNQTGVIPRAHSAKYQAVKRADHVICISESTRSDLLQIFDVAAAKVSVVHLGCDLPVTQALDTLTESNSTVNDPYLLYVGQRGGYKNFKAILAALGQSVNLKNKIHLLAFGGGAFSQQEYDLMKHAGLDLSYVHQVEGDDVLLSKMYREALALVYPSIYEGFGLPPIEAMAQGCPVVSSNTSSMPEVIDSAAEFFDPLSTEALALAIERVVYSAERREELIRLGHLRASAFSWPACVERTEQIYRGLL
jgi:glycosyltransferase involved in cell wall biosynthesis